MVTPENWAPNTQPTPEQMAEWLECCTVEEREWFVDQAFKNASEAQRCWMMNHEHEIERLRDELRRFRGQ